MTRTGIMAGMGMGIGRICISPYTSSYPIEKVEDSSYSYPYTYPYPYPYPVNVGIPIKTGMGSGSIHKDEFICHF